MSQTNTTFILKCKNKGTNDTNCSFETVSTKWLSSRIPELKPSSVSRYRNLLNLYLLPYFSSIPIGEINRGDVASFSRKLLTSGGMVDGGLSPKTVNSTLSVLKNIFKFALKEEALTVDDISDISVKNTQKPPRVLSNEEQKRLSEYLCQNPTPCNLGILLSLYSGLRLGETCALRWKDINTIDHYVYIHQNMQRIQTNDNSDRKTKIVIMTPKSVCSIRTIPIPDKLNRLLMARRMEDDAFLLTGSSDKYVEPRCMENRFKAVSKKCNLKKTNYHMLRHTFATRCVELGFDIKSLSEILGHANVNITLNRYVHPSMEYKKKYMDMLSMLLTMH